MSTSNTAGQKIFLLTPLRKGRPILSVYLVIDFRTFLLTPLREGRPASPAVSRSGKRFLLTPLREGRQMQGIRLRMGR